MKSRNTRIYDSTIVGLNKLKKILRQSQIVILDDAVKEKLARLKNK